MTSNPFLGVCFHWLGGLAFGLTMRYPGMSLGMAVALGYCAVFGTLVPPIATSFFAAIPVDSGVGDILGSPAGLITLTGVAVCLLGIFGAALAGLNKEREMPEAEKKKAIAAFSFKKGILVATFSGIMSACFAFARTAGNPIGSASRATGTDRIWTGRPKLVGVLLGGFTTNFVWCVILNLRNRTGYQYLSATVRPELAGLKAADGESGGAAASTARATLDLRVPRGANYCFSALVSGHGNYLKVVVEK